MQLLIIALALGIFLHDGLLTDAASPWAVGPVSLLGVLAAPKLVVAGLYGLSCRFVTRRLGLAGSGWRVRRIDQLSSLYQYLALALYGLDLYLGALGAIRGAVGDLVLVDELLVMLPTLGMILWGWWAYYPIDRRLREAGLIARIDSGQPVYPIWTRGQFLLAQWRHQVLLILGPLLLIMAWAEVVEQYAPLHWAALGGDPRPILVGLGALGVFLLAPVMLRYLWDTAPLPPGEVRDSLVALCARHGVHVRELLLWRTFGGMINAAVMGLTAPLRYILLTDALLDALHRDEVEAVMAHELGHVRRHHMFWLLVAAVGALGLMELAIYGALSVLAADGRSEQAVAVTAGWGASWIASPTVIVAAACGAGALGWIAAFGWVSRRFERQADTFAVQSMAAHRGPVGPGADGGVPVRIDPQSAQTMIRALRQVARLNHLPPARRSWRHGSIAWRQAYLRTLVGRPIDGLPIDRQMRWIKLAAAASVVVTILMHFLL